MNPVVEKKKCVESHEKLNFSSSTVVRCQNNRFCFFDAKATEERSFHFRFLPCCLFFVLSIMSDEGELIYEGTPLFCGSPVQWWQRTKWRMTSLSIRRETGTLFVDLLPFIYCRFLLQNY